MCQSYLTAMQERWGWLLQITSCIDSHLRNTQAYNQVRNLSSFRNAGTTIQ